MFKKNNI